MGSNETDWEKWNQRAQSSEQLFEDLHIELIPAPLGKRLLALIVDISIATALLYAFIFVLLIVFVLVALAFGALGVSLQESGGQTLPLVFLFFLVVFVLAILFGSLVILHGYFIWFEVKKGHTPGKRIMGLRVVSLDHSSLRWSQAIWREMLRYVDSFLFLPGLIAVSVTKRSQRLGDLVAKTMVVHSSTKEAAFKFLYIQPDLFIKWDSKFDQRAVPKEVAGNFLRFAYPRLISKQRAFTEEEVDFSIKKIEDISPGFSQHIKSEHEKLEVIRFFAEHCRRSMEGSQK